MKIHKILLLFNISLRVYDMTYISVVHTNSASTGCPPKLVPFQLIKKLPTFYRTGCPLWIYKRVSSSPVLSSTRQSRNFTYFFL